MTLIVTGLDAEGHAWMGGDRCAMLQGQWLHTLSVPKVWRIPGLLEGQPALVGVAGAIEWLSALREWDFPCQFEPWRGLSWYAHRLLLPRLQAWGRSFEHPRDDLTTSTIMLAGRGEMMRICGDTEVVQYEDRWVATGGGMPEAWAMFRLMDRLGAMQEPRERIRTVMEISADLDVGVRGPFDIINDFEEQA